MKNFFVKITLSWLRRLFCEHEFQAEGPDEFGGIQELDGPVFERCRLCGKRRPVCLNEDQ